MVKKVLIPGLLGAFVYFSCIFISNVVFGFTAALTLKPVPNERAVYDILSASVTEPGVYTCNPPTDPERPFPGNGPVYGILYSGIGHDSAFMGELKGMLWILVAPIVAAWMLSVTSEKFISRFANRLLFFVVIGCMLAVSGDLSRFGIGGYPWSLALTFTLRTVIIWMLIGLAVAWRMQPRLFFTKEE